MSRAARREPCWFALGALTLGLACASSSRVIQPTSRSIPSKPGVIVPYPPPPARVEILPAAPSDPSCLWLDGQWQWSAEGWLWEPGAWVRLEAGCEWVPASMRWQPGWGQSSSTLLYWKGYFLRRTGQSNSPLECGPPPRCDGTSGVSNP